jgi:hypothetical protein
MDERRCVLWTPQLAARDTPPQEQGQATRRGALSVGVGDVGKVVVPSIEIDKSESVTRAAQGLDGGPLDSTVCPCQAANFICIKPEWSLADIEKAYSHLVLEGEAPEEIMLDVEGKHFRQFVKAAEVGLGFFEQAAAKGDIAVTLGEMIDQAGCGEWLTERDVGRVLTWVAKRALEMDVETGWEVPGGYKGIVLNLDQLNLKERTAQGYNGPSAPDVGLGDLSMSTGIGSTIDQPISLSDSDEDDNEVCRPTPPKRPCSNEANGFESPTKKQRVTKAPLHHYRVVPDLTPTPTSTPTPTPAGTPNESGRRDGSPPPRRTRWTAAQQLAMVSKIYQAGHEGADYDMMAQHVNQANPTGPAKTRQRVKSAMRETHWTNFVNNNDGDLINQLTLNMPDMTGPPVSKTSWTGPQKVIVWAETFGCGEKRVK